MSFMNQIFEDLSNYRRKNNQLVGYWRLLLMLFSIVASNTDKTVWQHNMDNDIQSFLLVITLSYANVIARAVALGVVKPNLARAVVLNAPPNVTRRKRGKPLKYFKMRDIETHII
jgi:hypothetical protein